MFNNTFYPTPINIINKMLYSIDFKLINSVLEPSAGKGDIVNEVIEKLKYAHSYYYNKSVVWDIDTIEIDENLQHVLKGKGYRTVHNDFLTYNTYKKYDAIIMNPPFSTGDKHLLKALEMQESGGQIVCLLNAETLRNPYSNIRKDLVRKLEDYNAEIEYIQNAFADAERKTGVEIAIVKVNIIKTDNSSIILDELKKQEQHKEKDVYSSTGDLISANFIQGIIEQYNFEIKTGLRLIDEYEALKPYMLTSFKDTDNSNPILSLVLTHEDKDGNYSKGNSYIKQIRMKYWKALFSSDQFMGLFTSNLKEKYISKINELRDYDFSAYNIYTIKIQLNKEMIQGVEDTILKLFDDLSYKNSWDDKFSQNIHYYNGWATNKAYKINDKKVIIPLNGFGYFGDRIDYNRTIDKLSDIEKVFDYLQYNEEIQNINLSEALKMAQHYGKTRKIELKYFYVTFYKKQTCHIHFKYPELVHKFNVFGSQRRGWLPFSYGKKNYKDMEQEEKTVVNSFEGEESYNKVVKNKNFYIVESSKLLLLA